jgi:hypothetical protein
MIVWMPIEVIDCGPIFPIVLHVLVVLKQRKCCQIFMVFGFN